MTRTLADKKRTAATAAAIIGICAGFTLLRYTTGYLLFHSLVEVFAISVAVAVFLVVWSTRDRLANGYLLWIGISYLFVAAVDLVHTLAYKGMGTLPGAVGSNTATQLWLVARMLQALAIVLAPAFARRKPNPRVVEALFALLTVLGLASVLWWRVFPTAYVDGVGLTSFKIATEWVIVAAMASGWLGLYRARDAFAENTSRALLGSIALTAVSELCFALYTDVYGVTNLLGHLFKLGAFFLLYRALVEEALQRPLDVLFREVAHAEQAARELFERQRGVADTLQAGMLAMPEVLPGVELAEAYRSSSDLALIGGDFYDAFSAPGGLVCFVVGDVSGKGIAAAQLTQITRSTLRAYAAEDPSPGQVLRRTDRALASQVADGQFVTAVFCALDPATGAVRIACAGHPTPVICGPDACSTHLVEADPPLGLFGDIEYRESEVRLRPGELVVAYTDGLLDTRDGEEHFGDARVREILHATRAEAPAAAVDALMAAVGEFGHGRVTDDVAVLAVRWPGPLPL